MIATRHRTVRRIGVLASAIGLFVAGHASAALIPLYVSQTVTGGTTQFSYQAYFTSNNSVETLKPGDTLTLYDVGPLAATNSTSFTFTTPLTGVTPAGLTPTDSATIRNVTLTYTGAATSADSVFTFTLTTATGTPTTRVGQYASTDSVAAGPAAQLGPVVLPTVVPEPTTLVGLALAGSLGLARRRRRA